MPSLSNFSFMEEYDAELAKTGASAERAILENDPKTCIANLRIYAEDLSKLVGQKSGIPKEEDQQIFLERLKKRGILKTEIWKLFDQLRYKGNKAIHKEKKKKIQNRALQRSNAQKDDKDAVVYLKYAWDLSEWFHKKYGDNPDSQENTFIFPLDLKIEDISSENYRWGLPGRDFHNFWLIKGIAGSGKTYFAINEAKRLNSLGCKVLVLVFNEAIGKYLRKELDEQISVYNYHAFCEYVFLNIVDYPWALPKDFEEQKVYCRDHTPNLLEKALDEIEASKSLSDYFDYDAIIIDEGQDFHPHWWKGILRLAKNGIPEYFYFFYDPDQNYQDVDQQANVDALEGAIKETTNQEFEKRRLYQNCRNTKKIATKIYQMFNIEFKPSTIELLPDGELEPEESEGFSNSEDERKWIEKKINYLIKNKKVQNNQIAIVSLHHFNKSIFKKNPFIGNGEVFNNEEPEKKEQFPFVTARRVKGLEYDYVIVIGFRKPEDLKPDDPRRLLLYLSASRAKKGLYLAYRAKNYRFIKE